jgi:hypothetical protein
MDVGNKIKEFDNSNGTLIKFNEIFNKTPLLRNNINNIEILNIVNKNEFERYLLIDNEKIIHNFYPIVKRSR